VVYVNVATSIANGVRAVIDDYDTACKRLLSERQILSRIMHDWLEEFSDTDVKQIERECLIGKPRIGEDPVGRDEAAPGMVGALSGEDATVAEGTVNFDIRFEATTPHREDDKNDVIYMEMDVEAQNVFSLAIRFSSEPCSMEEGCFPCKATRWYPNPTTSGCARWCRSGSVPIPLANTRER
jgi:hypothetical protein